MRRPSLSLHFPSWNSELSSAGKWNHLGPCLETSDFGSQPETTMFCGGALVGTMCVFWKDNPM